MFISTEMQLLKLFFNHNQAQACYQYQGTPKILNSFQTAKVFFHASLSCIIPTF